VPGHAQSQQRWFHRHPVLALGGFALTSLLVFDVLVGSLLTTLGMNPALRGSDLAFRIPHEFLHHALEPGVSTEAEWGPTRHPFHTNSLGFKDSRAREVSPRTEGERILLMGDSFTEGIGIRWEDTFAGVLEMQLTRWSVEILNAGVSSYAPIIHLRLLEHLLDDVGLEIDRAIVFIDPSDIAEEALSYRFDEERRVVRDADRRLLSRLDRFVARRTVLISTVRSLYESASMQSRLQQPDPIVGAPSALWTTDDDLFEAFGRRGLALASAHMTELRALLRTHEIALTVVVYPWPDQIAEGDLESRQVEHWRAWSAEHDADFLNLFPSFMDGREASEISRRYFIPGDVHWNRAGHSLVANAVFQTLRR